MPSADIVPHETLARFLIQSNQFSRERVKYNAFLPHPDRLDLSVFRIEELEDEEIWDIGEKHVANPRGKQLYGAGKIAASSFQKHRLDVVSNEPPPRHADILNWPQAKEAQKAIALELASEAILALKA